MASRFGKLNRTDQILYSVILLEGFVTISLEILTIRQLLPVVGSNVIVTSLIIGIFLLFLAYGYRRGGQYTKNFKGVLRRNFIIAAAAMGVGLSYLFVESFFRILQIKFPSYDLVILTAYLLLIIAPTVYLLGQTVPITINLWRQTQSAASTAGHVLHISTLGSFLGATLTTLILLNYFGVAKTVLINYSILSFLIILLVESQYEFYLLGFLLIAGGVIVYALNNYLENNLFVLTNNYANYQVITQVVPPEKNLVKLLKINDSASSFINANQEGFAYIELIKRILFKDLNLHKQNILVLGAGGFTLTAKSTYGNYVAYVDIDKQVYPIARRYMVPQINGEFIAADARQYLRTSPKKYAAIISDTYSNHLVIPSYLLTAEYFMAIRKALTDTGIAIFNIIMHPTLSDRYSKHVDNTLRAIFPSCMAIPLHYSMQLTNVIYVCQKSKLEHDTAIYTDDLNRAVTEGGMTLAND